MKIRYTKHFQKNFIKRIPAESSLDKRYLERVTLFLQNRNDPVLKNHKLSGKLTGYFAFSITGDIRVLYYFNSDDEITFIDIGSHNQVYTE